MSKNRIVGAAHKAAGAIKEAAGKATGDRTLEAKGAAERILGDAQNTVGKAQDAMGNTLKR